MKILTLNAETSEGGGANKIAKVIFDAAFDLGHESYFFFSKGISANKHYRKINHDDYRNIFHKIFLYLKNKSLENRIRFLPKFFTFLVNFSEPIRTIKKYLGHEDFQLPGSKNITSLLPTMPDLIHAHNLHSNFFDIRELPKISSSFPFFITLHDCWTFTGHCCHFLECERWKSQCGKCPHLKLPMEIPRDGSRYNLNLKNKIFKDCRLHIATPSNWLAKQVNSSILRPAIKSLTVIPNGIDQNIFKPSISKHIKNELKIPQENFVISFSCNSPSANPWKNYELLLNIVEIINQSKNTNSVTLLVLGETGSISSFQNVEIRKLGWIKEPERVAEVYQASDLYLHVTKADTYPSVIMEAMSCGTPVIASNVGGISEQVTNDVDGILLPNDPVIFADTINKLMKNKYKLGNFSKMALKNSQKFNQKDMISKYYDWFTMHLNS